MADEPLPKIYDLLRLAGELAEYVLKKRASGQSITATEAAALQDAAAVLQNYEVSPSNIVTEALRAYDEDRMRDSGSYEQPPNIEAEIIPLPNADALSQRVFSMLGFK
ncbi:hypothetical protein [Methylobacterium sp. J-070]|uniref:hypothetical protein n=1 Tax=Methylobacterium sp. J-070 TaxID=2836650 RepID=UPI001FB9C439|nr:hypothetical protein [Methylobacterium sp. J-070]MCJ2052097.1 hypothetical protein [Methylobacterium sp. J-070]